MNDQEALNLIHKTFWSYADGRIEKVKREARAFVHYTSTDAALSIINNREIWLRNSTVMNDYSEMAHGEACLRFCLFDDVETSSRSRMILDSLQEGLHDRCAQWFLETSQMRRSYTYLLSISEHGPVSVASGDVDEESQYGRLSMWRAYGANGGVGLIFGQAALMEPTDVLNVYSSPVFYGNPDQFAFEYSKILTFIDQNRGQILQMDPDLFWRNFTQFLHFSILSCKHPGFSEEREWRITYSADPANEHINDEIFNASSLIKREFRTVNGIPQRIYKIPFVDDPDKGLTGITLPTILKRIVIGPTQYPLVVHDAIAVALLRADFELEKFPIALSQIPLRT
ncbi:DUF2971 domain-containing protein [Parasphingorhabdus sp.]|uniref:DUF2971 domain-containing protein n=1 Tax=Parasphingorhabdus sp. TaxID=2709688 RepID=UPI0032EC8C92